MVGIKEFYENGYPGGPIDSDFLEFYRLDLKKSMKKNRWRVYGLIGELPTRSRTVRESVGGEVLEYEQLMLAKIELLIRSYIWAVSDKDKRGPRPEIDVPSYMKDVNSKKLEELDSNDIANAYAWIYNDDFSNSDSVYM